MSDSSVVVAAVQNYLHGYLGAWQAALAVNHPGCRFCPVGSMEWGLWDGPKYTRNHRAAGAECVVEADYRFYVGCDPHDRLLLTDVTSVTGAHDFKLRYTRCRWGSGELWPQAIGYVYLHPSNLVGPDGTPIRLSHPLEVEIGIGRPTDWCEVTELAPVANLFQPGELDWVRDAKRTLRASARPGAAEDPARRLKDCVNDAARHRLGPYANMVGLDLSRAPAHVRSFLATWHDHPRPIVPASIVAAVGAPPAPPLWYQQALTPPSMASMAHVH